MTVTATPRGTDPAVLRRTGVPGKRSELLIFLVLAFGVWPFVAIGVVGGYGFLVWMFQLVFGPPGPPGAPH